jgi:DNA polymerase elongation subunit (family B)
MTQFHNSVTFYEFDKIYDPKLYIKFNNDDKDWELYANRVRKLYN